MMIFSLARRILRAIKQGSPHMSARCIIPKILSLQKNAEKVYGEYWTFALHI